jgi:hypothetical protein
VARALNGLEEPLKKNVSYVSENSLQVSTEANDFDSHEFSVVEISYAFLNLIFNED